jgi:putative transposase
MKRSRQQIIAVLKKQEAGSKTADVCRQHGISSATSYHWKAKYGGLSVSEAKPLRALESENARLKKLFADAMLDNAMLKDLLSKKMVTLAVKREAVVHLRSAFEVSERRACSVIEVPRMTVRYRSRRPDDLGLRERLRALAHERRRFGYRRLHVLLRREGYMVNHKRSYRLYCEERLLVRRRRGCKRALGTRAPITLPQLANERWSLDFLSDQLVDGRRFRILVGSR